MGYARPVKRYIGKIKWFNRAQQRGALASIGGTEVPFTREDSGSGDAPFAAGEVVTYTDARDADKSEAHRGLSVRSGGVDATPDQLPELDNPDPAPDPRAGNDRDRTARDRDERADAHDQESVARDDRAQARDDRAATREDSLHTVDKGAAADRAGALRDRRGGASDRVQAADDRDAAAADRVQSARDRAAASTDALTGAYRRDPGTMALERDLARAARTEQPFTLAFVDVDGLKRTNDSQGHAAGDQLLRRVADSIRAHLRSYDLVVRVGGDEFLCGLPGLEISDAAERFRLVGADLAEGQGGSITVGFARLAEDGATLADLIASADEAMYRERRAKPSAATR